MNTKSKEPRRLMVPVILAAACLSSAGCKDTLQLKEDHRDLVAQTEAVRSEIADLESKLVDLRKVMPASSTPKIAAEAMSKLYQKELALIAQDKAALADKVKAQEQRIAALQKEIADFKALSPAANPGAPPKS